MAMAAHAPQALTLEASERYRNHLLRPFLRVSALICEAAHMVPALFQLLLALGTLLQLTAMSPFFSTASGIRRSTVVDLHVCC